MGRMRKTSGRPLSRNDGAVVLPGLKLVVAFFAKSLDIDMENQADWDREANWLKQEADNYERVLVQTLRGDAGGLSRPGANRCGETISCWG